MSIWERALRSIPLWFWKAREDDEIKGEGNSYTAGTGKKELLQ